MNLQIFSQAAALAICISVAGLASPSAQAQPASIAYSADFTLETAEMAQTGKIYASAGKERRESVMEGMTMINIRREDLGKLWILMPSEQMYMEIATGQENTSDMAATNPADYDVQMTEVGPELLDGVETVKQKVIMTSADGSKMGGFWWISAEGIPIKMDMIAIDEGDKMRLKQQLSNLAPGEPDPSLFEIPAGYQLLSMPFGMGVPGMPSDD
jgi:hypothetical protein